jgi:phosphoenolpyruvate phosphomutase / 2-hydroxyethylphosphonate cytidylyltransferase
MPEVLILGSFDGGLHYGHLRVLNQASRLGRVTVGLGTDDYQTGYKRPPFLSYEERKLCLEEAGYQVMARATKSIKPLVETLRPNYLVAGSEWFDQPYLDLSGVTMDYLVTNNIALVYLPRNHPMSTTEIVQRVYESI